MTYEQYFFTLFLVVFVCLGWRIVTDEGMFFYFLRKPFEKIQDRIISLSILANNALAMKDHDNWAKLKSDLFYTKLKLFFLKPTILCITCYASVWGSIIFVCLNGIATNTILYLAPICISASFIQTFIWNLYDRISNR